MHLTFCDCCSGSVGGGIGDGRGISLVGVSPAYRMFNFVQFWCSKFVLRYVICDGGGSGGLGSSSGGGGGDSGDGGGHGSMGGGRSIS